MRGFFIEVDLLAGCSPDPTNSSFLSQQVFGTLRRFRVDTVLPRPQGVMKSSDVEKVISKMDPAVSKIYYDAKHVLETVEDSESEEFLAAARIVKIFWNKVVHHLNRPGSDS
jgi:hypothetical protein